MAIGRSPRSKGGGYRILVRWFVEVDSWIAQDMLLPYGKHQLGNINILFMILVHVYEHGQQADILHFDLFLGKLEYPCQAEIHAPRPQQCLGHHNFGLSDSDVPSQGS